MLSKLWSQSHFLPLTSVRTLSYVIGNDEAWKFMKDHRQVIGRRTMVVTADDKLSKSMSQRMWFEMQKAGIEVVSCTINTSYPTSQCIQDGVSMFKRTGANSIVTIGNASICDNGKAMQQLIENDAATLQALNLKSRSKLHIPHISVSTTISSVPQTAALFHLHHEEDVLIKKACAVPQVVVFDTSLISESPSYLPHTITPHLLGHLLDSAYSSSLVELCGRDALPSNALLAEGGLFRKLSSGLDFSHLLLKIAERETATSTGDDNSGLIEKTEIVSSIELAGRLALLRNRIHSLPGCSPVEFLGPIETAASVQALHLAKRGVMRPYSWICASVLVDFLQTAQAALTTKPFTIADELSQEALRMSLDSVTEISGLSLLQLVESAAIGRAAAHKRYTSPAHRKLYRSPRFEQIQKAASSASLQENVSASGWLQALIMLAEMDVERLQGSAINSSSQYLSTVTAQQLLSEEVESWVASLRYTGVTRFASRLGKGVKEVSLRGDLLKTDFFADLLENSLAAAEID